MDKVSLRNYGHRGIFVTWETTCNWRRAVLSADAIAGLLVKSTTPSRPNNIRG